MGVGPGAVEGVGLSVVVTGAAGYVGGRLVATLRARGWDVRAVVRTRVAWLGVPQFEADLCRDPLGPLLEGATSVVHLASPDEVAATADPEGALAAAAGAARRLAEAATAAGVRRFVQLSTVHVYGAALAPGATVDETTPPAPRHPYAIAHLAAEHAAATRGPGVVVVRLANAVGAPAHPSVTRWTLVANDLCRQAVTTGRLVLRTPGVQWRDFVTMADACRMLAAVADPASVPAGTYNVASGEPRTVRELASIVREVAADLLGRRPALEAPEPPGDAPAPSRVSAALLGAHGLRAEGDLREAVAETLRFCAEAFG